MQQFWRVAATLAMFLILSQNAQAADVIIHNPSWNQVTVEVRVGNNAACDQNIPRGSFPLSRGGAVIITTGGEDVCWRRERIQTIQMGNGPDGIASLWEARLPTMR